MQYPSDYVTITELRKHPDKIVSQLKKGAITLLKYQKPIAVLFSVECMPITSPLKSNLHTSRQYPSTFQTPPTSSIPIEISVEQKITAKKQKALWEAFKAF